MISFGFFGQAGAGSFDSEVGARGARPRADGASHGPMDGAVSRPVGEDGPASRPSEGTPFPTVLLALASIATPVHGMTTHSARPAPVLSPPTGEALGHEVHAEVGAPPVAAVAEPGVVDVNDEVLLEGLVADTVTLDPVMVRRLSQDFVPRLERVASRMWEEHGLRIDIVEGYRPQSRQNELFAQGRTAEGPVVTWTRRSLHTAGAAVDVFVDGGPVRPEQAVLLARVASEEGLRTLYPFDSGHIQLDRGRATDGPEGDLGHTLRSSSTVGGTEPNRGVAPVAPVARPARPARPGGMASIEDVEVGGSPNGERAVPPATTGTRATTATSQVEVAVAASDPRSRIRDTTREAGASLPRHSGQVVVGEGSAVSHASSGPGIARERAVGSTEADAPPRVAERPLNGPNPPRALGHGTSAGGPDGALSDARSRSAADAGSRPTPGHGGSVAADAARAAAGHGADGPASHASDGNPVDPRSALVSSANPGHAASTESTTRPEAATRPGARAMLHEPFESSQSYAYRRLHLPIDGVGGRASLDVGIRPGGVDASVSVSDPNLAEQLRGSLHELRHALAERGIDSRSLAIRLTADAAVDATSVAQEASPGRGSDGSTSSSSDGRRNASDRLHDERERDGRSRADRDQSTKEDRNGPHN